MHVCTKRGYKSPGAARRKLREMKRKRMRHVHHGGKIECRYYQCQNCRRYHLTSQPYDD